MTAPGQVTVVLRVASTCVSARTVSLFSVTASAQIFVWVLRSNGGADGQTCTKYRGNNVAVKAREAEQCDAFFGGIYISTVLLY